MEPQIKKNLIVYYSYTGNNRLLAEYLSAELRSDICSIIEVKKRSVLTMFMDIVFQRMPKIQKLRMNIGEYDHVLFLAPLWGGRIANPLKTLLRHERGNLKEYSFATFCGGSYKYATQLKNVREDLKRLTGFYPSALFELDVADLFSAEDRKHVMKVSNYRVKSSDLRLYKDKLKEIVGFFKAKENLSIEQGLNAASQQPESIY